MEKITYKQIIDILEKNNITINELTTYINLKNDIDAVLELLHDINYKTNNQIKEISKAIEELQKIQ